MNDNRISLQQYQLSLLIEQKITTLFTARIPFTAKFVTDKLRLDLPQFEINHGDVRRTLHTMLQGKESWNGFYFVKGDEHWQGSWALTYRPINPPVVMPFTQQEEETHKWVATHFPNIIVRWKNK